MSPKNNKEIFSIYFKEEERQKVEAEIGKTEESFKEKYEKVKSAQVDIKLDELEENIREKTDDNFEKRFEAFKKAVEKKEAELKTDEGKGLVASTVDKAKEKVTSAFRKKLADTPLIGGLLVKALDWVEDSEKEEKNENTGFWKGLGVKILGGIGIAALSFFGYNKFKESLAGVKGESGGEDSVSISEVVLDSSSSSELEVGSSDGELNLESGIDIIKNEFLPKAGYNLLKGFSGQEFETNLGYNNIYKQIKDKSQKDIQNLLSNYIDSKGNPIKSKISSLKGEFDLDPTIYSGEDIFKVLSIFSNQYANILYRQRLNKEGLLKIVLGKDGKIKENFKNKKFFTDEQIRLLEEGKIDDDFFRELSLEKVCTLMVLSYKNIIGYGMTRLKELGVSAFEYIKESDIKGSIIDDIKERKENLLPVDFSSKLPGGYKEINYSLEDLKRDETEYYNTNKEKIDNFFSFKEKLFSFMKKEDIHFGVSDFMKGFNEGINFTKIIELYTLFDGKADFEDMFRKEANYDTLKKAIFTLWISKVLEKSNPRLSIEYHANIIKSFKEGKNINILSEDDVLLLKSLSVSFGEMYMSWAEKGIVTFDEVTLRAFTTMLETAGVSPKYSEALARCLEVGGIALFLFYFKKLNLFAKIAVGTSVFLPVAGFLIKKFTLEGIKRSVSKEMYKNLDRLSTGTYEYDGYSASVKGLEDIEKMQKDPNGFSVESISKSNFEFDDGRGVITVGQASGGLHVKYDKNLYELDIGPFIQGEYDLDKEVDNYNGEDLYIKNVKYDEQKDEFLIGKSPNIISIPKRLIIQKVKKGNLETYLNQKYITLIDNHVESENLGTKIAENIYKGKKIILRKL